MGLSFWKCLKTGTVNTVAFRRKEGTQRGEWERIGRVDFSSL
jgi:hypothetical protein